MDKVANILKSESFYNHVSSFYDKMINFEKNLDLRTEAYKYIFPENGKAADIGCGIGLDSIALAMNGNEVFSFDSSVKMINEVRKNAGKYKVKINAGVNSFNSIPDSFNGRFNYVISVGNTIAHLNRNELKSALARIKNLLLPGGKMFLHILNYDLIIKKEKRINNIAVRDGQVIIRFYDFEKSNIYFNILSFKESNPKDYKLVTTKHYPHKKTEIGSLLKSFGFVRIKFYSNFMQEKYIPKESKDVFVEAFSK